MSSCQIWPCHVTQTKDLSFLYLKSYCPLNFRKRLQMWGFCEGGQNLPPPPRGIGLTMFPHPEFFSFCGTNPYG